MMTFVFALIGLASGALLGLVGTGAGLVIIPALIYFAHFNQKTAVGTSLTLLLAPVGLLAASTYWKHGYVNVRAAIIVGIGFVIGSYLSSRYAVNLSGIWLERTFGVVAIGIGIRMLFSH